MRQEAVLGVILCGGAGARIGGRKAMVPLAGRPMAAHVADLFRSSAVGLAVAGDAEAASALGVPNLDDPAGLARGPLAGVLSALEWGATRRAEWIVTAPCDTPLLPGDVVVRILEGAQQAEAAFAQTEDGPHPLVCAWRCSAAGELRKALIGGHPPVRSVLDQLGAAKVCFDEAEAFMNVNTPEELKLAELRLAGR